MRTGVLLVGCLAVAAAQAQSGVAGFFNPLSGSQNGIHLYGVNVNGGYFSGGSPFGQTTAGGAPVAGASTMAGASASFGWSHSGGNSGFSVNYSPSYVTYPDQTGSGTFGQAFSLNWHRKVGQKWSFNVSATGQIANLQQTLFAPNAFGQAASLPTTFEDLAGAMITGQFTDAQLAASLTGASARILPEQASLYGSRMLAGSLTGGVNYAVSERSSFHVSIAANRVQALSSGNSGSSGNRPLIPQTTGSSASLGWAYSLSTRTNMGIDVSTNRIVSQLQDGYASNASFSISRTMSQHWFVQGGLGGGLLTYTRQTFVTSQKPQYSASGSIGLKLQAHTLLASYGRSIGDVYGLGGGTTSSATAGWALKPPGSRWSLNANYGYQRTDGSAHYNTESWRASGGIGRALSGHLFISAQYAYLTLPSIQGALTGLQGAQSGVSMGLNWSPSQYR